MNPYEGVIHTLLTIQILSVIPMLGLTNAMMSQLRVDLPFRPNFWELARIHRQRFPNSPLRWMRVSCLTLNLALFGILTILIHENSVQNHIYFANAQKQIQINAQLNAETKKVR